MQWGLLVQSSRPSRMFAAAPTRVEICPPALQRARPGWRQRFVDWLVGGWPPVASDEPEVDVAPSPGGTPLESVRFEFVSSLDDIATAEATDLAFRLQRARSLRELWHLRTEVFNIVSRRAGQHEATSRLQRLNRHFPARAPRSGFGGFDAEPRATWRR